MKFAILKRTASFIIKIKSLKNKGKEIYAFFTDTSASIYRIEKSEDGYDDFLKLIEKFREDRNVKELTKNLTDIWSDYNVYEYDSNYVDIQYALRGVAIQFNVTSEHGLIVYKNYIGEINEGVNLQTFKDSQATVPAYTYIKADEDLVFNTEIQRCFAFEEIVS